MKRYIVTIVIMTAMLLATTAWAEPFPDVTLEGSLTAEQQAYLGVSGERFSVADIQGEYLFIEGYSMYCPICQRDAPHMNAVFEKIRAAAEEGGLKFLGIAFGNTSFETAFYRKKYNVQFPLVPDADYTAHKALNEVGTPTFYIVRLGAAPEIVYKHEGEAKGEEFLLRIIEESTGIQ